MELGLSLNTTYLLSTKADSILNIKVIITGLYNYDRVKYVGYNINLLAINEKIISEDILTEDQNSADEYFKNKLFYYAEEINDNKEKTGNIYIIWDDIVDFVRTTQLEAIYKYDCKFTVNSLINVNIDTIINKIMSYIISEFSNNVTPEFAQYGVSNNTNNTGSGNIDESSTNSNETLLQECLTIINKLSSLKQLEPTVDILVNSKFVDNIKSIRDQLSVIQEQISSISSIIT
jgi:hypothetical protein